MSGDLTASSLNVNMDSQEQALKNIQQLQEMEKNLYTQLETLSADGNSDEQDKIITKINELSEMRMNMFKNLGNTYDTMLNSVAQTRVDLVDQMTVVGIVENELNNAKKNLNKLENAKNNKMRMVEINTYYQQRYSAHTRVIKLVIMITIPLLILAILNKKQLIPPNIANILTTIILAVGAFMFIRRVYDLSRRDNMVYDEYNWNFNPASMSPTVYEYDREQLEGTQIGSELRNAANNLAQDIGLGCVGAACCSKGMNYSSSQSKCVEPQDDSTTATDSTTSSVAPTTYSSQITNVGNNMIENFDISSKPSYVISSRACPLKNNTQNVQSFSPSESNYATV